MGKGEAETIALGVQLNAVIITDDRKAMNACKLLRISFTTVPNLLVQLNNNIHFENDRLELILKRL